MPLEPFTNPDLTDEEQLRNAHFVSGALQGVLRGLERQTSEGVRDRDQEEPSEAWLGDISRTLIRGECLTIEPGVSFSNTLAPENLGVADLFHQPHSLALAGLFRAIAPRDRQVALVTMAHNIYSSLRTIDPNLLSTFRKNHVISTAEELRKQGVLRKGDMPGRDYTIVSTGQLSSYTDVQRNGIVDQLRQSEWGEVVSGGEGKSLRFDPNESLRDLLPPFSKHEGKGLTIKWPDGIETKPALHAQALKPILGNGNHLTIANATQFNYYRDVFALLRAADGTMQHRFHTIREYDYRDHRNSRAPGASDPTEFAYSVGRQLKDHVQRFIDSHEKFDSFQNFDPYEYAMRNYGGDEALKEDRDICKILSFALPQLGIRDAAVAEIGPGSNLYPSALFAPFAKSIELLEFAKPNRDYLQAFFNGTLPQGHVDIWPKFERYMQEGGGQMYNEVFAGLQQAAQNGQVTIKAGNIFKLPKKKWTLSAQFFVDDSISIYRSDYREAVASMCGSIIDEGLVVSGNMLNDKSHVGYNAGDDKIFPNISQNVLELKQAYTDNGMYSLVIPLGDTRKAREGYHGMVLTLAAKRNSVMHLKLEAVKIQLQAMGYAIAA
jgi:hypothetical protein